MNGWSPRVWILGLLAASTTTVPALAQGKPPATKPAPAVAAAPAAAGLSLKEAKYAAIVAWLGTNPKAADRAEGLGEAADLAAEIGKWGEAKGHAEAYGKEFADGERSGEMKLMIGKALANLPGRAADAKKAFADAFEAAGDDVNAAVAATSELAELLVGMDDKDGAEQALHTLSERFAQVRGLKEFVQQKRAEIAEIGVEPKPIDVTAFDGKPLKLSALKGKVVLIDFWATWCGPCIQELPNVIAAYKKYHGQGFEIVGISLDQDEQKLKDFLASHDMPWPQFFDGKGWQNEVGQLYGVQSIPKTYLLDRDGKVRRVGLRGEALGREVQKLLAQKAGAAK